VAQFLNNKSVALRPNAMLAPLLQQANVCILSALYLTLTGEPPKLDIAAHVCGRPNGVYWFADCAACSVTGVPP
jgi:hypothetical protein